MVKLIKKPKVILFLLTIGIFSAVVFYYSQDTKQIEPVQAQEGNVYYVSSLGDDTNPGTQALPWKTISKVNRSNFQPGDFILFKRDEIWREQLTVPSSGSSGSPITFGAYGTGADPIISGADIMTGFAGPDVNGEYTKGSITTEPEVVIVNDVLWRKGTIGALTSTQWAWDSDTLYLGADPTGDVEVGQREFCIYSVTKDYITIDGLEIRGSNSRGIYIETSSYNNIENNTVTKMGIEPETTGGGIYLNGGATLTDKGNNVVSGNTVTWVVGDGIYVRNEVGTVVDSNISNNLFGAGSDNMQVNGCDGVTASRNVFSLEGTDSPKGNIIFSEGDNSIVEYNLCSYGQYGISMADDDSFVRYNYTEYHGMGDAGVAYSSGLKMNNLVSDNVGFYYNISNQDSYGIIVPDNGSAQTNLKFYNNTIFNPVVNGGQFKRSSGEFKNNILYTVDSTGYTMHFNDQAGTWKLDNNLYYPEANNFIQWDNGASVVYYDTLAEWQGAVQTQDANSIAADPLFISTSDFRLQATSPCINAGIDVGLTQDYAGNGLSGSAWDIGAYEYQEAEFCPPLDLDCSGDVTLDDLTQFQTLWGQTGKADFNQDNITNVSDLAIMMSTWGN